MTKIKIPEAASLGSVLTKDELKTIVGGAVAIVECKCLLTIKVNVNGHDSTVSQEAEPYGNFLTQAECSAACAARCNRVANCTGSDGIYTFTGSTGYEPEGPGGSGTIGGSGIGFAF